LLLLQKTMMVAEGVGRQLNADLNMWEFARPLIEDWVVENLGPEARLKQVAREAAGGIERMPQFLANIERAAATLAERGFAPYPDPFTGPSRDAQRHYRPGAALWVIAGLLAAILAVLLARID
jgi:ubiquinone biosynthesis protein